MITSNVTDSACLDWRDFLKRPICTWSGDTHAVENSTILITGAGGSIGSALSHTLMGTPVARLLLLDNSRKRLEVLCRDTEERKVPASSIEFIDCDIRHTTNLERVFSVFRPDVVFHAAAMKHLAPLESDPFNALETNFTGTSRLIDAAIRWRVRFFVNVSTDKSVKPTSVLGISKRISERLLLSTDTREMTCITARLGNVLGSSGSVVPRFLNAIRNRWPVTITHPDASRYFMTVDEVVAVLLCSLELTGNSLLLPNMEGERKIVDLADFLIEQCSLQSDVIYVGLRDGEKCHEQLTYDYEHIEETGFPGVLQVFGNVMEANLCDKLARLQDLIYNRRGARLIDALTAIEPEFTPSPTLLRNL